MTSRLITGFNRNNRDDVNRAREELRGGSNSPKLKYTETDMEFEHFADPGKFKDPENIIKVIEDKQPQLPTLPSLEPIPTGGIRDSPRLETPRRDSRDDRKEEDRKDEDKRDSHSHHSHHSRRSSTSSSSRRPPKASLSDEGKKSRREETPDEKKQRAAETYRKLMELQDNHKMKLSRPFYPDEDADVLEREFEAVKAQRDRRNGIIFYKKLLLQGVSIAEFLNKKYDPLAINLNGWWESMNCSMDEYTEVFEDLHEKYKSTGGKMEPEVRLLMMVGMSAFSFHISKEFAKSVAPPAPVNFAAYQPPPPPPQQAPVYNQPQVPLYHQQAPQQAPQQPAMPAFNLQNMFNGMMSNRGAQQPPVNSVKPPQMNVDEQMALINKLQAANNNNQKKESLSLNASDVEKLDIISPTSTQRKNNSSANRKKRAFIIDTSRK